LTVLNGRLSNIRANIIDQNIQLVPSQEASDVVNQLGSSISSSHIGDNTLYIITKICPFLDTALEFFGIPTAR
jgi:hypothetical protein